MRTNIAVTLALICAAGAAAHGQERDRYLLLATTRTSTMEQEVNEAAAKGYRVVAASRTEGSEVIVVLEQARGDYRYRLLATTRTGTLQKEISDAAQAGFHLVPKGVTTKRTGNNVARALGGGNTGEGELLVLMEKGPEPIPNSRYLVVATSRTGTMQKELSEAVDRGYVLLALTSRGEHVAILEQPPGK